MGLRGDHLVTLIFYSAEYPVQTGTGFNNPATKWPAAGNADAREPDTLKLDSNASAETGFPDNCAIPTPIILLFHFCNVMPSIIVRFTNGGLILKGFLISLFFTSILYSHAYPQSQEPLFRTSFEAPLDESDWVGNLSMFRIDPSFDEGMLRLDAPRETGMAWIATRHKYNAVYWEWSIRQAFAPSNNNRAFIFINSVEPYLDGEVSGKAIRTGENGNPKHFRLLSFEKGISSPDLLKSDLLIEPNIEYRIRVVISPDRMVHLYIGEGDKSTPLLQSEFVSVADALGDGQGHFGFRTHFTATRSDQFFFGDVAIWDVLPLPKITEFKIVPSSAPENSKKNWLHSSVAKTTINLTFNVPPDASYLDISLFELDDGTYPDQVHCDHAQTCTLIFDNNLAAGERSLTVNSYKTIYGQQTGPDTLDFLVADKPAPADVIINEFMYRPPDPVPPYVELFTRSGKLINLKNWKLQRRALASEPPRIITSDDLFLHPGDYLVLTSDKKLLIETMDAENVHEMNSFPPFNKASVDEIRLLDEASNKIDSLQYDPSGWGGFQVALERKSAEVPGWISINWGESPAFAGGTPGFDNLIRPPHSPPRLVDLDYTSQDSLILRFDRMLQGVPAVQTDHFDLTVNHAKASIRNRDWASDRESDSDSDRYIDRERARNKYGKSKSQWLDHAPSIPISAILTGPDEIVLIPEKPLSSGFQYRLLVKGIKDVFGNEMIPEEIIFQFYLISEAGKHDIVINEILYRPSGSRFIEILNRSDLVFDLRDWKIGRSLGNPVPLFDQRPPDPVYLVPGEKMVISNQGFLPNTTGYEHIVLQNFPALSRFGDAVYVVSDRKKTIDSLFYQPEWGGNKDHISIERIDPFGASKDPANWKEHPTGHSAGLKNFHFQDHPDPVVLLHAAQINDHEIILYFSRFIGSNSLTDVTLNGRKLEVAVEEYGSEAASVFLIRSDQAIERREKNIHIEMVRDFAGRMSYDLTGSLSFLPLNGDIIINEIMYQPIADRYSMQPDQSEYLELFNRSGLTLQMKGLHLHDRPDKNSTTRKLEPENTDLSSLPPGGYAVFFADTSSSFSQSRIARAFNPHHSSEHLFFRIDRLTLGFSTSGDEIYLADKNNFILDSLWYQPSWHNPNIIDKRGISLERIHPDSRTSDPANWTSSAAPEGGTPGQPNSTLPVISQEYRKTGLHLEPNPFSPNGDGHNDHLVIFYHLDQPDFLMHVRIFDRQGRHIRTLADGMRAGTSGQLIWDGRTDSGLMNRTGLYIIHFEAFNSAGGTRKTYRGIAVLAKPR